VIRVLLVDDHRLVLAGLQTLLAATDDIEVVGTASDGQEALERVAAVQPDIVLMDLSMPRMDGVEATRRLLADHPTVQVVVLTSYADTEHVQDAVAAGAVGYVLKDAEPAALVEAIRGVARGESPLDPRVTRTLLRSTTVRRPATDLTARETEVLLLVAQGLANKQIARQLGITERTVKAHLTNVFGRIGVADRTSAALWAQRHLRSD